MIGRADIEGSKSNGASMNDWLSMPSIGLEKNYQGGGVAHKVSSKSCKCQSHILAYSRKMADELAELANLRIEAEDLPPIPPAPVVNEDNNDEDHNLREEQRRHRIQRREQRQR